MNAQEELESRVRKHAQNIHHVEITWNASDGGPRMDVVLKGENGLVLDTWNDDLILGNQNMTGAQMMECIVGCALGRTFVVEKQEAFYLSISTRF